MASTSTFSKCVTGVAKASTGCDSKRTGLCMAPSPATIGSSRSVFLSGGKVSSAVSTSGRVGSKQFTVYAGKKGGEGKYRSANQVMSQNRQPQGFKMPELDKDDSNFMIFVKSSKSPIWNPLSMVTGGTTAKALVQAQESDFGKSMGAANTLTRNLANVIYNDEKAIKDLAMNIPALKKKRDDLVFGYKLVDNENPRESMKPVDVIQIPSKKVLKATKPVGEKVGEGLRGLADKFQGFRKKIQGN